MKNVIFGAICSPHILEAVLKDPTHRFCKKFPEEAEQMSRSMYMDDGIFVADSPEQTKKLMSQAEAFFAKASFASLLADRQQERDDERATVWRPGRRPQMPRFELAPKSGRVLSEASDSKSRRRKDYQTANTGGLIEVLRPGQFVRSAENCHPSVYLQHGCSRGKLGRRPFGKRGKAPKKTTETTGTTRQRSRFREGLKESR